MLRPQRRNKVVFFRVSEEELAEMEQLRLRTGARSLSEVARVAVKDRIGQDDQGGQVLAQRVNALTAAVMEMDRMLRHMLGTGKPLGDSGSGDVTPFCGGPFRHSDASAPTK